MKYDVVAAIKEMAITNTNWDTFKPLTETLQELEFSDCDHPRKWYTQYSQQIQIICCDCNAEFEGPGSLKGSWQHPKTTSRRRGW